MFFRFSPIDSLTKDKDAFVELLNGWIDKTVKERLEQAQRDAVEGFAVWLSVQPEYEKMTVIYAFQEYLNQTKEDLKETQ